MRRVFIASPYAGDTDRNVSYAKAAMHDSLWWAGEAPFVPHLLYPQVLNDATEKGREQGIKAAGAWLRPHLVDALVVYADLGVSPGMVDEMALARARGIPILHRWLGGGWSDNIPSHPPVSDPD